MIFKEDSGGALVRNGGPRTTFKYYQNGFLRGTNADVNPYTGRELDLLIELLRDRNPDVVGRSTRSFWGELGADVMARVRRSLPGVPIVAGGWGPMLEPDTYLATCDAVCFGEGESAIPAIGDAVDRGGDLRSVPNLVYRDGGALVRNPIGPPIRDLDTVPFPDFGGYDKYLIDGGRVRRGSEFYNDKIYDIFVGRGCPLNCTYCLSGRLGEIHQDTYGCRMPKTRLRSPANCVAELEIAKARGAEFIRIKDEVFPGRPKWVAEFLRLYKGRVGLPFFAYLRPEFHSPETMDSLVDAGLRTTGLGLQSGSDEIRKDVFGRKCTNDRARDFANELRARDIEFHYDIITDNPFETPRHLKETFDFLTTLPPAPIKVFRLAYLPAAPIAERIERENPKPAPACLTRWYAVLYCMVMQSKRLRRAARWVERFGLFRHTSPVLQFLFVPHLVKEIRAKRRARKRYKAASQILPGAARKTAPQTAPAGRARCDGPAAAAPRVFGHRDPTVPSRPVDRVARPY